MANEDPKPETPILPTSTLASPVTPATPEASKRDGANPEAAEEARAANEEDRPAAELVEPTTTWGKWGPLALAAALPLAFFFVLPPLTKSGLWDPFELNVADLARRVALNVFGAGALALDGADNSLPHLNDLGRPELPFDSVALGFKLFGLHEWAGRMPLALWGVAGVLATYAFVARLIDRRAGLFAAAVLTTTPLYFVQARTILGDVVTMASLAMAFGGLAVAVFDRDEKGPTSIDKRAPWILMGVLGLLTGYMSRGGFLGVAGPALGIAGAWGVTKAASSDSERDGLGAGVAVAARACVSGAGGSELARYRRRLWRGHGGWLVIEQDPVGGAVEVVVLAGPQRPEKETEPECGNREADREQIQNDRHGLALLCRRRLLAITSSEELDIAAAASHGVTHPATARGTMITL